MKPEDKVRSVRNKYSGRIKIALQKAAKEMAVYIVDIIKIRTRIEGEGTDGKLKPLKPSTIKNRNRYSDNLSPDTDANTSNLTATGQMIDALRGRAGGGKVTVDIKPTRRKDELNGGRSGLTNNEVRAFVEKDREFLKLSEYEKRDATELAKKIINDHLKGLL